MATPPHWIGRKVGLPLERSPSRHLDRKSTRLNSSHRCISYAVFCLKKKTHDDPAPLLQTISLQSYQYWMEDPDVANPLASLEPQLAPTGSLCRRATAHLPNTSSPYL